MTEDFQQRKKYCFLPAGHASVRNVPRQVLDAQSHTDDTYNVYPKRELYKTVLLISKIQFSLILFCPICRLARGSVVGLSHYDTIRKVAGSIPDEVIGFFYRPNPSNHTMVLGSTQPLTEMSTRNLPAGKRRPAHKAICEQIV
jgi:hypothetical protein